MILISLLCLSTSCLAIVQPLPKAATVDHAIEGFIHKVSDAAIYGGAGVVLGSASFLGGVGWAICQAFPGSSKLGNEFLLLSQVCGNAALHSFGQMLQGSPSESFFSKRIPLSQSSWYHNRRSLAQIPAFSERDAKLLLFLERRWLAKSTGCFSSLIDWLCPCFGILAQIHPESTNSYARDPWNKLSETYQNRIHAWKELLPHPKQFPLILTRPSDIQDFFPHYLEVLQDEPVITTVEKLVGNQQTTDAIVIVDLTHVLPDEKVDQKSWLSAWQAYQLEFFSACKKHTLNFGHMIFIQRLREQEIGGIRLLPFSSLPQKLIDQQDMFLLELVAKLGLSANRIELDRLSYPSPLNRSSSTPIAAEFQSKEGHLSYLCTFEENWKSDHPQKNSMLKGALEALKGLLSTLSESKWEEIMHHPTKSAVASLSFSRIKQQLELLAQEDAEAPFFTTISHIEQIHANLTCLLEIFSPFTPEDFPSIYRNLLTTIPEALQPLVSYGIHSSGMTSLTYIFKSVEKTLGRPPRILYGENTYFENIYVAERISNASSILDATDSDWKEVDLLLAQFNPVLKRIDFEVKEYRVEKVADALHKALIAREKPLTLALDCTLDFINSPRVGALLTEFQKEIEEGILNIVCYRSGLKFDLFGMDNYCGAPLYMIHNQDTKWTPFDTLLNDPALQTDRLSLNWFCLAYQNVAPYLELYRKQIFDNTRAFLNKIPKRLFSNDVDYRIVPVDPDADPGFVDIKISGPLHAIRGGTLVGGLLTINCMKEGHPLLYRPSIGLYHPNISILYGEDPTTARLTLGLDPSQIDLLVEYFETIDTLNGPAI